MILLIAGSCFITMAEAPRVHGSESISSVSNHSEFGMEMISSDDQKYTIPILNSKQDPYPVSDIKGIVEGIPENAAVIVDDLWYDSYGTQVAGEVLSELYWRGNVVASMTDIGTFLYNSSFEFAAYVESADLYAAYHDPVTGRNSFCNIVSGSEDLSMEKFREWVRESISHDAEEQGVMSNDCSQTCAQWGEENSSYLYRHYDGYGWMNVNTDYFALNEDNHQYNYFYTHYCIQSVPDDGCSTADLNVYTKLGEECRILDYAPTTSSGTSTAGVNLGVSSDGVISANISWSYSVSDVEVIDRSNFGTNEFRINHDLNEDSNVGSNTFMAEPGKIVRIDCSAGNLSGSYIGTDHYEINFCKKVHKWPFSTKKEYTGFSEDLKVYCYSDRHDVSIYLNGAEAYAPGGIPDVPADEFFSKRVSDGGYVEVEDYGYLKNGYIMAGFSTNMSAVTPEFIRGSAVKIESDMDLYMIWVRE